jgi:putative flavoprotein involved in K+ transport
LVVGASHSGADIAFEIAPLHPTVLAGPIHGEIPFRIEGGLAHAALPVLFFVAGHLLTIRTPVGRRIRPEVRAHGGPFIRVKKRDLVERGVELVGTKVVGVQDGSPLLDGGRVLDVENVIWCTGFRQRLDWIKVPVLGEDGWPEETRGVTAHPGLYFAGLAFQFGFTSMLVGGAGRDAEYVVDHLVSRSRSGGEAGTATARRAS